MAANASGLARRLALLVPLALLGGAYIAQYGFGLFPCEMCLWQRYPLFAAVAFALVGFLAPRGRIWIVLAAGALAVSGAIGAFHAGVEYGWWQGVTACTVNPGAGSDDPMTAILNARVVRCDMAPWSLAGISLAGWNFLFSTAAALAIILLMQYARKEQP